jgi:carboxyl-terminal processing protease
MGMIITEKREQRMFKTRSAQCVCQAVLFMVLISFLVISGSSQQVVADTKEAYKSIEVFSEVLRKIEKNYVEGTDAKELVYGALKGMVQTLDPHSSFITPEDYKELMIETKGSFPGVGIVITMKNNVLTVVSPIEGTPADKAGIKAGDQIVMIGDRSTKDISIREAVKLIRGPKGTKVKLTVQRKGLEKPMEFVITRDVIPIRSVRSFSLPHDLGYIRISNFQSNTADDLAETLGEMEQKTQLQGLVLDLRNNPGGLLSQAVKVADEFLDSGLIVSIKSRDDKEQKSVADRNDKLRKYPMVVLVNEGSASASEIVAGALQDNKRALVLGTTTFGKGSVQTLFPLSDGSGLRLTTALYYTPNGRSIQASGIEPDIKVAFVEASEEPTIKKKTVIRERDLEGHIEQEGPEPAEGEESEIVPDERTDIEKRVARDNQLRRAIQILHSWSIFSVMERERGSE